VCASLVFTPFDDPSSSYFHVLGRNEVVGYLGGLDDMASHLTTRVPMQVLTDIDNGRNPMHLTKDRLERAATENQFMNGKITAIEVCVYWQLYVPRRL
jgi:mediator of RNA polymerase II transcription subunit 10